MPDEPTRRRSVPVRQAVAMWDFSWLLRRHGVEDEYRDWDRVLDELVQRGYTCVRIDAFPHLVAGGDADTRERFVALPQMPRYMWGNHEAVEVEPRRGLAEFSPSRTSGWPTTRASPR